MSAVCVLVGGDVCVPSVRRAPSHSRKYQHKLLVFFLWNASEDADSGLLDYYTTGLQWK